MNENLLKGRMAEKGFTQEKLAENIGISTNSLSRKMHGYREFRLSELISICNILEIDDPTPFFFNNHVSNTQQSNEK